MPGIGAGHQWGARAEKTVRYADPGISGGMAHGIARSGKAVRNQAPSLIWRCHGRDPA